MSYEGFDCKYGATLCKFGTFGWLWVTLWYDSTYITGKTKPQQSKNNKG